MSEKQHDPRLVRRIVSRHEDFNKTLDLPAANIYGPYGVKFVVEDERFKNLKVLRLSWTKPSEWGCQLLSRAAFLPGLKELDLSHNELGWHELWHLIEEGDFRSLRKLDLGHNPTGDIAGLHIANDPKFETLEELHLPGCGITSRAMEGILTSPHLKNLRELDLGWNESLTEIGKALLRERLKRSPGLRVYVDEEEAP